MANVIPKLLILMRHGIAGEYGSFAGQDKDRPLTAEGIERTRLVARRLTEFYLPDLVIASDYLRAVQTAKIVLDCVRERSAKEPRFLTTPALRPEASFSSWLDFLRDSKNQIGSQDIVLAAGHNHSINDFFAGHLGLEKPICNFKKAGISIITPYTYESGELTAFLPPKFMDSGDSA